MKKLLLILISFACCVSARSQTVSTRVVGTAFLTNSLPVTTRACKVFSVSAFNTSGSTEYLQISTNSPASGSVPIYSYPIPSGSFTSYDFSYYGADLDSCQISISTNAATLGLAPANCGIQAIIRSN